jgi:MG2 domain/Macroglobulin domain MG3
MELALILHNETAGFKIRRGQLMTHNSFIQFPNTETLKIARQGKALGRKLKFLARRDGQCVSKEVFIIQEPYIGHVFIQVDRPTFMPGEEVKFRVVAFDDDTKPIEMNNIKVVVEDSDGKEVITFKQFSETDQLFKSYGLYEKTFKVDESVRDGRWRISVKIDDNDNLFAEKYFEVSRKEAPLYEIKLEFPKVMYMKDKEFTVSISSVFKFGSFVKGAAKLNFTNEDGEELYSDRFAVDTKVKKTYHLGDDLQINYISGQEFIVNIFAEYTDNSLGTARNITKKMKILKDLTYEISLAKPHSLRPGFKYQVIVSVKDPFGRTISNSGRNNVKLSASYIKNDGTKMDSNVMAAPIKNSVAEFVLLTSNEVERINLSVKYLESKITEVITKESVFTPSLRIYVNNE